MLEFGTTQPYRLYIVRFFSSCKPSVTHIYNIILHEVIVAGTLPAACLSVVSADCRFGQDMLLHEAANGIFFFNPPIAILGVIPTVQNRLLALFPRLHRSDSSHSCRMNHVGSTCISSSRAISIAIALHWRCRLEVIHEMYPASRSPT